MSKFFEFVSANLRLAGNLMISPSERFHAGQITSTVTGLAFEGLRGVTESFDAAAHSISKKAHKSLWATFCDSIDFSESIQAFGLMAAPSERTSVAAQSLWTTYCDSSAYAETRMPQVATQETAERRSLWANFGLMAAPSERSSVSALALWTTYNESSNYAESRMPPAQAQSKSERSSWWANFSLMVSPSSMMSPVAMRVFAQNPILAQIRAETAEKPAVQHESVFKTLAQTSAYTEERTDFNPAEHAAPAVKQASALSHERLADLLAQSWLTPTDRLVQMRATPHMAAAVVTESAPETQAETSMSHERLADLLAQSWLTPTDRLVAMDATQHIKAAPAPEATPEVKTETVAQETETVAQETETVAAEAETSMSHERLADLLAQSWLDPADHLVAMRATPHMEAAPAPEAAQTETVAAETETSMSHERLADLLAQSWLTPAQDLVSDKPAVSVAHARLADLLAQCSLSPTQRLVDLQVAPKAPEVKTERLSSYALATLTEQPALTNEELTSLYLKRFNWLDSTQTLLMAHLAQTIAQSDNEVKNQEPETEAYVASRWNGIVAALTEDTPQAIAALPNKAPVAPEHGVLAALKHMTASESKKIAAQVSAGRHLPRLS